MPLDRPLTKRETFHVARLERDLKLGKLSPEEQDAANKRIAAIKDAGLYGDRKRIPA